jgi:hypothetical protein
VVVHESLVEFFPSGDFIKQPQPHRAVRMAV